MFRRTIFCLAVLASAAFAQYGNPAITTGQYNNGRTSANTNETILDTSNVNVNQFGKLFSWSVDDQVYAQPLYVPGVTISGKTTNVVYVATMHNSLYAFDAENPGARPLWHVTLGQYVNSANSHGCPDTHTNGEVGILSTPVIDPSSKTMYVVAANPVSNGYAHYLHALDITTGADKQAAVLIHPSVSGNGYDSQNGVVTLTPSSTVVQRTALLLANGSVYAGFGNCGQDADPFHGWVVGYSTSNLQTRTALFNSTPNSGEGGIWQAGRGLTTDSAGDIYVTTGNATDHAGWPNTTTGTASGDAALGDYPMRFVKLTAAGQFLGSYPAPNYAALNTYDLDFSSSGPVQIGTNLMMAGGKDGIMYVFNTNNLASPVQSFQATGTAPCADNAVSGCDQIRDLAFWNSRLYVWGTWDVLRVYNFNGSTSKFATAPSSQTASSTATNYQSAAVAVSANGTTSGTGIVWGITPVNGSTPTMLHAFDASNVATELWNSNMNSGRDGLPSYPKFTEPTIANGRVYVGTHSNQIAVYGLLRDFSLSASTSGVTAKQGSSTQFTVSTVSGFTDPVTFSIGGLPSGATASFFPASVNGSGSTTVTISTTSSTPTGTYHLIVSGSGDGLTSTASLSLFVTTSTVDTTPPQWSCCTYTYNSDGSYTMTFSVWDAQSGLKSIKATEIVDATVSIPNFPVGTNNTVNFSARESGWSSYVQFQLMDVAGNVSTVDPVLIDPDRQPGTPSPLGVKRITQDVGVITIQNGTPGLKNVRIDIVNGINVAHIQVAGLHDGEVRVVDITSSIPAGGTAITLTPLGKPGGHGLFVFANAPLTGATVTVR